MDHVTAEKVPRELRKGGKNAAPRLGAVRTMVSMMVDAMGPRMLCIAPYKHLLATYCCRGR